VALTRDADVVLLHMIPVVITISSPVPAITAVTALTHSTATFAAMVQEFGPAFTVKVAYWARVVACRVSDVSKICLVAAIGLVASDA
jgi:hypothetical protein